MNATSRAEPGPLATTPDGSTRFSRFLPWLPGHLRARAFGLLPEHAQRAHWVDLAASIERERAEGLE